MPADPELLGDVPFFQTLDDEERRAVAALMEEARFSKGATIFRENDPGGVLYVITAGRVELSFLDEDRRKVVVAVLDRGEFFGEVSLLDGGGRSATAVALEAVRAFSLARAPFLDLLRRRAEVALDMVAALGKRLRHTDEMVRRRVPNPNVVLEGQRTLGDRVADAVARFGGSWAFIGTFAAVLVVWVLLNTAFVVARRATGAPFDPYPFILLNLLLSMLAAIQAPVIMMSQNRQDLKDRVRSELDYQVNVKAELEIVQLLECVDAIKHKVERLEERLGASAGLDRSQT